MDLRISITDDQGDQLGYIEVYQDGSDSEGAEKIRELIRDNFKTVADANNDEFECERCGRIADNDDSVRLPTEELVCFDCSEEQDRRDEKNGLYPDKEDIAN